MRHVQKTNERAAPSRLLVVLLMALALGGLPSLLACGGGGGTVANDGGTSDPTPNPDPEPEPEPEPPTFENEDLVRFVETSAAAGLDAFFLPGIRPSSATKMAAGGAAGDFNRDGLQDLFVLGGGTDPDKLFLNDGDGTFTESAAAWGVSVRHLGIGASVGDYDGDGWLDLYVTSFGLIDEAALPGQHRLYRNTGIGSFENRAVAAGVDTTSDKPDGTGSAFGDYDLDGDLDLFVCAWSEGLTGNRLFRNDGDGTFTDVTATAIPPRLIHGLSVRFADMNGDRYPELLVVGDFYTSAYYVNRTDGTFADRTDLSGVGVESNGMGSDVADLNGDGRLDWYVSSIHRDPQPDGTPETGNVLYINQGGDFYEETGQQAGAIDGAWGWGIVALDVDHDGFVDLAETNGWTAGGPTGPYSNDMGRLFLSSGTGYYLDIAAKSGFDHAGQGRGLIRFDLENDGDQDLVVFTYDEPMRLFRNDTDVGNHWLRLVFDTSADDGLAPDGVGTRVRVTAGGTPQYGYLDGGCTYLSQSELSVHFGLGAATTVTEVRVEWADGRVTTLTDVTADQTLTIESPGP